MATGVQLLQTRDPPCVTANLAAEIVSAASGQAAAAPPSAASKSRRPMVTGMCPSPCEGCLVKGTIPRREHAAFTFGGWDAGAAPQLE